METWIYMYISQGLRSLVWRSGGVRVNRTSIAKKKKSHQKEKLGANLL